MNYRKFGNIMGKIMIVEGMFMTLPLAVSLIYRESYRNLLAFLMPILLLFLLGGILQLPKSERKSLYQKEGFAVVGMAWIVMTLFGALPFVINGDIPNYVDACFEIMSGFTTTGASIIEDVTTISYSGLFWRSFSHWIGGMGILVFILIFIPESKEGYSMHMLRAESPGPQVGKLVSRMRVTTRILYSIYLGLTVLLFLLLMLDQPIPGYEKDRVLWNLLAALGCAGTGGFGFIPGSIELFSPYSQYVMAVFLLLFGCNFSLYYLLLIGKVKEVFKSGEFRTYIGIIVTALLLVFWGLMDRLAALPHIETAEEAFRHSLFQVASLMTTAGFTTTDYDVWPMGVRVILLVVMCIGGMAGSTAGGIKVSRVVLALKWVRISIRKMIDPHYVRVTKLEGKKLEEKTITDVFTYMVLYVTIVILGLIIISLDPVNGQTVSIVSDAGSYRVEHGFFSNFSAVFACISNVGPGFEAVGPYSNYAGYSAVSKIILTLIMLLGRLEILPIIVLCHLKTWRKG